MYVAILYTNDIEEPVPYMIHKTQDRLVEAVNRKLGIELKDFWYPTYHRIPMCYCPYKSAFYQTEFRLYITRFNPDEETMRGVMRRLKL